jgi:hypothetical protein
MPTPERPTHAATAALTDAAADPTPTPLRVASVARTPLMLLQKAC